MRASKIIQLKPAKLSTRINLTKSVIDKLSYTHRNSEGTVKQKLYWDAKLPGFGLLVGLTTKTFIAQRDINGRSKRVKIDKLGIITPDQARNQAQQLLAEMGRGVNPNERKRRERAQHATLRETLESYKITRKTLSEKTRKEYTRLLERYMADWLDKPLTEITPDKVAKRHTKIAEQVRANPRFKNSPNYSGATKAIGESAANDAFRALRTIYNHALAVNEMLPPNPVKRLSATKAWYPENRRTGHIKPGELKTWLTAIGKVPNDLQRDYAYLVLFTGLRRNEAATIEWCNVDLENQTLHIPITKNKRTLDIPLSDFLSTLLVTRRERSGNNPYVFPATSKSGHIEEPRHTLDWVAKECGIAVSVHDLRRTFITIAEACDVPHYVFKALVNHSVDGDVTGSHYVQMSIDRLRPWMQKITDEIVRLGF